MRAVPALLVVAVSCTPSASPSVPEGTLPSARPETKMASAEAQPPRTRADYLALGAERVEHGRGCTQHRSEECSETLWSCACGDSSYGSGGGRSWRGRCFAERRAAAEESASEFGRNSDEVQFVLTLHEEDAFCGWAYNQADADALVSIEETPEYRSALAECRRVSPSAADECDATLRSRLGNATGRGPTRHPPTEFQLPDDLERTFQQLLATRRSNIECGSETLESCSIVEVDPCRGRVITVCEGYEDFDAGETKWSPDGFYVWRYTPDAERELMFEAVHRPPP